MISACERERRQLTLAALLRLLRAGGFDLRLHLAAYDPHDNVLARLEVDRSDTERTHRIASCRHGATPYLSRMSRERAGPAVVPVRRDSGRAQPASSPLRRHRRIRGHRQQAPIPATRDIDITPDATAEKLTRLSHALTELGARIRTEAAPEGLPFGHDAASLAAAEVWNLICDDGEFDISFHLSGFTAGYSQLAPGADRVRVGNVVVMVADLDDVIRSKEAAGRPKDL